MTTVLVVEDEANLREALCETLGLAGYAVESASDGVEALERLAVTAPSGPIEMVISDVCMKPMDGYALLGEIRARRLPLPVLLMTAYGTIQRAVEAMQAGAADYLVKPFDGQTLIDAVKRHLPESATSDPGMVAIDQRMRYVVSLVSRVAATDATVLITGESGAGKEVLARSIHRQSSRADRPFVAINCAAIPENMLEATLFGYEKGAFTGAYQSAPGKFEQAQGGTLLLDEISEMDLGLQAKLLRVLQEREVERLGGRKTIALDVRVLATSNRNLSEEVAAGRFREDLYYRLNVFPVHVPPLRERRADILPLARRIIARIAHAQGRTLPRLSEDAERKLMAYGWPGNVRELDNALQRALILQGGAVIEPDDLQFENPGAESHPAFPEAGAGSALDADLRGRERQILVDTLKALGGSRRAAAQRLGISERTLRYKLARLREAGVELP
jgi:two-component system response regulator FlrC